MISANGGLPAHRYTPKVTERWPRGSELASGDHVPTKHLRFLFATTLLVTTQCKPPPPPMSQHQHGSSISTDQVRVLGDGGANFSTSMHCFPTRRIQLITCLVHPWLLRVPHEINRCTAQREKTCEWEMHRNRAITVCHCNISRGGRCILGSHRSITWCIQLGLVCGAQNLFFAPITNGGRALSA